MADSLRVELEPDGIHVSIVEPGTIVTPIWTKPRPLLDTLPTTAGERYGTRMDAFRAVAAKRARSGASPDIVVQAVEHALTAQKPKTRYLVGRDAKLRAAIERLPDRVRDRMLTKALLGG
jgi:short-subunit dehydrogenase